MKENGKMDRNGAWNDGEWRNGEWVDGGMKG